LSAHHSRISSAQIATSLALDPGSAPHNAMSGFMHFADGRFGWSDDREAPIAKAEAHLKLAPGAWKRRRARQRN
jgi:hypothetical protein